MDGYINTETGTTTVQGLLELQMRLRYAVGQEGMKEMAFGFMKTKIDKEK